MGEHAGYLLKRFHPLVDVEILLAKDFVVGRASQSKRLSGFSMICWVGFPLVNITPL